MGSNQGKKQKEKLCQLMCALSLESPSMFLAVPVRLSVRLSPRRHDYENMKNVKIENVEKMKKRK